MVVNKVMNEWMNVCAVHIIDHRIVFILSCDHQHLHAFSYLCVLISVDIVIVVLIDKFCIRFTLAHLFRCILISVACNQATGKKYSMQVSSSKCTFWSWSLDFWALRWDIYIIIICVDVSIVVSRKTVYSRTDKN